MNRLAVCCVIFIAMFTSSRLEAQTATTYLALGDSYTIGEGVDANERWPVVLAETMGWGTPTIVATTGWTSSNLLDAMAEAELAVSYDVVTLLIGVNDQFQGKSQKQFRKNLKQLIARALKLTGDKRRVVIVSIPDYSVVPFAKRLPTLKVEKEVEAFNAICRAEAKRAGVPFIDITPISLRAKKDVDLLADDALHPSAAMYRAWVEEKIAPHFRGAKKHKP